MGLVVAGAGPAQADPGEASKVPTEWRDMGFEKACANIDAVNELHPMVEGFIDAARCYRTWAEEDRGSQLEQRRARLTRARKNLEMARSRMEEGAATAEAVDDLEHEVTSLERATADLEREAVEPPPSPVYGIAPSPRPTPLGGCACDVTQPQRDLPLSARLAAVAAALLVLQRRSNRRR